MRATFRWTAGWFAGACLAALSTPAQPPSAAETLFAPFNQAESICILRLGGVEETPSNGPAVAWTRATLVKVLRGSRPRFDVYRAAGPWVTVDQFKPNQDQYVAFTQEPGETHLLVEGVLPVTEKNTRWVSIAMRYPMGWTLKSGKPVSPWPAVPGREYRDRELPTLPPCDVSGRPPFLLPPAVRIQVDPVLPPDRNRRLNPRGDGVFTVTVENRSAEEQFVPALRQADGRILWEQSLVILQDREPHVLPGADQPGATAPVLLPPRGKVQTTVNLLEVPALAWPPEPHPALPMPNERSRMWFRFCIGDRSARSYFEFHPRHHRKLLNRQRADAPGSPLEIRP